MRKKRGVRKRVVRSRSRRKKPVRRRSVKKRSPRRKIKRKAPKKVRKIKKRSTKKKSKARKPNKLESKFTYLRKGHIELPKLSYVSILNEKGRIINKTAYNSLKIKPAQVKEWYKQMVLARTFDQKALNLQKQGRMGTYLSVRGQEACQVPAVANLKEEDWVVPAFRENAALIARGVPLVNLYLYWGGDERGHHPKQDKKKLNNLPVSVPVGSHPLHATGIGMAARIKKQKIVAMSFCGDGATSEGDFHVALNFAGVFHTPTVFMVQNNQWAISLPVSRQTAASSMAQKALAYGFEGIQVDGNDVFAVYQATKYAIDKARNNGGPTLIECVTYRYQDHSTADMAKVYRKESEVKFMEKYDPFTRLEAFMKSKKWLSENEKKQIQDQAKKQVEQAVTAYENIEPAPIEDIFNYTFAELTPELKEQMEYALAIHAGEERKKNPIIKKIEGGFP